MKSNEILSADLLDILFEGKNKDYGAYELRKTYNKRIAIAVAGMLSICMVFSFSRLIAGNTNNDVLSIPVIDINLVTYTPPENKIEPIVVPPPKTSPAPVETIQFTRPLIVKDFEAPEPMHEIENMEDAKIGLFDQKGSLDDGFITPPVEKAGTGNLIAPTTKVADFEKKFTKIEKEAMFPGGAEGWKRYLERNLDVNIATDEGASVGMYKVMVQFVVDKDGSISQVKAIEVPKDCPGCGPEAVRVIKKGPKWIPAIQNGIGVTYQAIQSVTFQVVN